MILDVTGPPSSKDAAEAAAVVRKFMLDVKFMVAYPELAVQLPNLSRICRAYGVISGQIEAERDGK